MPQKRIFAVKGLNIGLPELGHIKIGRKGKEIESKKGNKFQPPEKLDHFIITSLERGADNNFIRDEALHEMYGSEPKELLVRLVYGDIQSNFPHQYACYNSTTAWCRGDGEKASRLKEDGTREEVDCTCERIEPEYKGQFKCKLNGCLSVVIDGAPQVGGVWTFRTTSNNSVRGLLASLVFIQHITGGQLANIPLKMKVFPKKVTIPGQTTTTVYIVGLFFDGTMDDLGARGLKAAQLPKQIADFSIDDDDVLPFDRNVEVIDEFYQTEEKPEVVVPVADRIAEATSIADLDKLVPELQALPEGDEKTLARVVYEKKKKELKAKRASQKVADAVGGSAGLPE